MAIAKRHSTVKEQRLLSGLTQAELAARAGVSRQLVAAVETGHNAPSVDAALRLAGALETTVEELFAEGAGATEHVSALGERLLDGAPLRIGRVGDRLVAAELADRGVAGAGWGTPDGTIDGGRLRLYPGAAPAGLVIAGCDPALGIAEAMLRGLGSRSLLAISAATGDALTALQNDAIHAAVVHGAPGRLPEPPVPVVRLHFARWQVGLGVTPALQHESLEALVAGEVPIAQRDAAASSQRAFARALAAAGIAPPPPGPKADGHLATARIAAATGGAAVTTESAARAFGLGFIALEAHTVEVWCATRWRDQPGLEAFADLLTGAAFTERVAHFGGYDLSGCGSRAG
jgi:transcriptional regulator with XRE-family HTH domain